MVRLGDAGGGTVGREGGFVRRGEDDSGAEWKMGAGVGWTAGVMVEAPEEGGARDRA